MVDNLSNEAKQIYEEVEKRKQRAIDLGLDKLISYLYFHEIEQYPDWIRNNHVHGYVCSLVTDAVRLDNNWITKITLLDREYFFKLSADKKYMPDNSSPYRKLELFCEKKRILTLTIALERNKLSPNEHDRYYPDWVASGIEIESFIEGDWINDFKAMKTCLGEQDFERKKRRLEQEKSRKENPKLLKELKEDFGI